MSVLALFAEVVDAPAPILSFTIPLPYILQLVVAIVLPLAVGLLSRSSWSPQAKAILLAVLAAVTALLSELWESVTAGTTYDLGLGLIAALGSFLVAVGLHFGIYSRPGSSGSSLSSKLVAVGSRSDGSYEATSLPPAYMSPEDAAVYARNMADDWTHTAERREAALAGPDHRADPDDSQSIHD